MSRFLCFYIRGATRQCQNLVLAYKLFARKVMSIPSSKTHIFNIYYQELV